MPLYAILSLLLLAPAALPGEEDYLAAREAERHARYADALSLYGACGVGSGPLAPYAQVRHAFCRGAGGDKPGAIAEYEAIIAKKEKGPWQAMARIYLASLLNLEGQYEKAAQQFQLGLPEKVSPWWVNDYEWAEAKNNRQVPDRSREAYDFFSNVVRTTYYRNPRLEAAGILAESPAPEDQLLAIFAEIKSGSRSEGLKRLLAKAPQILGPGQTEERWTLFTAAISRKTEAGAAEMKARLRELVKGHEKSPWIRTWLAYLVRDRAIEGEFATAQAALELIEELFPEALEIPEAIGWLAYRLKAKEKYDQAITLYAKLAENHSEHNQADDALLTIAELQRTLKRTDAANATLLSFIKNYPRSRHVPNVWYWLAETYEGQGKPDKMRNALLAAVACGPGDFYAHRALERLVKVKDPAAKGGLPLPVMPSGSLLRPFPIPKDDLPPLPDNVRDNDRFQRLRFFASHGLEEAEWEALGFVTLLKADFLAGAIYRAMGEAGIACSAMNMAQALEWGEKDGVRTPARLRVDYPRAYWPHVQAIAKEVGIDPYLILAVARQESTFRPALTSHAGARGVMQVMPGTADWLAKVEPQVDTRHAKTPEHPLSSLRMGAYYLMRMIERSEGNLVYALASYNAGPGNCNKWRKKMPNADMETFIEAIPFTETKDYVKRVLGNYAAYYSLYEPVE